MDNSDSKPPTPEEISKKLADFMKSSFGDSVNFSAFPGAADMTTKDEEESSTAEPETEDPIKGIFDFNYLPKDIKRHLDRFVIRQEEAKKVLSLAVCDHYNHSKYLKRLEEESGGSDDIEFTKQNVIILGPTGVGKTYLIKHIAELIGVPFVKADATKFSETGYVGGDVDDLVRDLVKRAEGDVSLAEYGIIYIDEIDKLATSGNMMGRDVSGRGVQTALLKLMEDTEVSLRNPMDMQSQMQSLFDMRSGKQGSSRDTVRTRHILFIVSGAFAGLDDIIAKRVGRQSIGFEAGQRTSDEDLDALHHEVATQDFMKYGFEAEFIGRLPVRVVCDPLKAADLVEIMETSEGSLIRQYEREFQAYGIKAEFDRSALEPIAEQAAQEKTGARGLMTVCEAVLRDFKFELADSGTTELKIDGELVSHPDKVLARLLESCKDEENQEAKQEVGAYVRGFREQYGLDLQFSKDAIGAIAELSKESNMSILTLCEQQFRDFQYGLKLIQKNTGQATVEISHDAVMDPDRFLSKLVMQSYDGSRISSDTANYAEMTASEERSTDEISK